MHYGNIFEKELKNKVAQDYFEDFDTTRIIGKIDFCVSVYDLGLIETQSLLWAEAKKGRADVYVALVQLILTIGKARTFDEILPPPFLAAFDAEKIAFLPYNDIYEVFYQNDFNWNVAPSNHETKEFKQVFEAVKTTIEQKSLRFFFGQDDDEIKSFIAKNLVEGNVGFSKVKIDKNNFLTIYNKWLARVKPTIQINWEIARKNGIIDSDFYLADLLSRENLTLKDKLYVLLKRDSYELYRKIDDMGLFNPRTASFSDKQKAHHEFWNKYERPPKEEYWDYIVERRDLLVPQDIRERKGSFFTPQIWVELSQRYLKDVLGDDWQDEYYIWDCAAGTGNLLAGLTNKYHIWASTLDQQDVDVMHDRIQNGANLLEDHVFQFDFLNNDFEKLPEDLREIINGPEQRKKLVIYITPPYAEASSRATVVGKGENKSKVATETKVYAEFQSIVGTATRELFAQFFLRAYRDIPEGKLAIFSKMKYINAQNFFKFREYFKAKYKKGFIVPADTFDNVSGKFPIGFLIWDFAQKSELKTLKCDIISNEKKTKKFYVHKKNKYIIDWLRNYYDKKTERLAYLRMQDTDMQNNRGVFFTNAPSENDIVKRLTTDVTENNVVEMSIYLTVRHIFKQNWINDRDQFLYPNKKWEKDAEFQADCLAYALFHGQNRITAKEGVNHWIPFYEQEVQPRRKFKSNFMADFISGKIQTSTSSLFEKKKTAEAIVFSSEAKAVFEAGKQLWTYTTKRLTQNPMPRSTIFVHTSKAKRPMAA
jgi:hypothetical protein